MIRMRYYKDENHLVSPPILMGEKFVYVELDPGYLVFNIKSVEEDMILVSGEADTLDKLKKEARDTLNAMGSKLGGEIKKQSKLNLDDL